MALGLRAGCHTNMSGERFGEKLQRRARELGLSDAEVARRVGLGQSRYANYLAGTREPDFATLAKICRVLNLTPNILLEFDPWPDSASDERFLIQRILAALPALNRTSLRTTAKMVDVLAATQDEDCTE